MSTTTPGTSLQLVELTKTYAGRPVLSAIDLAVDGGHFVAIVGRSGCGKSTLLRLLSGLEAPCDGGVLVNGEPLRSVNLHARIMFQDGRLLPWKSVLDNVGLGLRGDWRSRGLEVLRHVGLHERAGDWIARLSGGQRQRVALAKALITQPRLMLLDEPLGALDALTRIEMQQLIENLWLEEGFTSILVTHDVEEAVTLADRILVLEEGRIARDFRNDLQRPRRRGDPGFSQLTAEILDTILTQGGQGSAPQKTADHATEAVTPEHGHSPRPTGQPAGARSSERSDSPPVGEPSGALTAQLQ